MIDLAWTGGYDSTYRLLELLEAGKEVRTHYLGCRVDGRESVGSEIETIRALEAALREKYGNRPDPCAIVWEMPEMPDIERQFDAVNRRIGLRNALGAQYLALAGYAEQKGIDLEVCAEPGGRMQRYLDSGAPRSERTWMRRLTFPLLRRSKGEMMAWAEDRGMSRYLLASHTCRHPPALLTACGDCEMCRRRIAAHDPMPMRPYPVDLSICVVGNDARAAQAAMAAFAAAVPASWTWEAIHSGGTWSKASCERVVKEGASRVLAATAESSMLAGQRNACRREAQGRIQLHLSPGASLAPGAGDLLPWLVEAEQGLWAPVPKTPGNGYLGTAGTPAYPEGRGPWHIVAGPWWAFRRIGGWRDGDNCDATFRRNAPNMGIRIARKEEPKILWTGDA